METFEISVPCHFGIEAVLKKEIYDLGYEITRVDDGRVSFVGDAEAVVRANMCLGTGERVLIVVGRFFASTFTELFDGVAALPIENYVRPDGRFWVTKATSVKSKLFAVPTIQSVVKKAMVERMKKAYHREVFKEEGCDYPFRIFLYKDEVLFTLDTTGVPLHKRGYRTWTSKAPLSETLASALIDLTPWHPDRIMLDPFCGSGTFLIEAARMAAGMAPGMDRHFTCEAWDHLIPKNLWQEIKEELLSQVNADVETHLYGYDIDPGVIDIARKNAKNAGVDHLIHFQVRDVADLSHSKKYGFILTNPPYGERLLETDEVYELYRTLGEAYNRLDSWSMYVITSFEQACEAIGRKPAKNRKIYNGMIKTYFYQFPGPKPPKRRQGDGSFSE